MWAIFKKGPKRIFAEQFFIFFDYHGLKAKFSEPFPIDMDNDGMIDSWETQYGLNPNIEDASGDPDGRSKISAVPYRGVDVQLANVGVRPDDQGRAGSQRARRTDCPISGGGRIRSCDPIEPTDRKAFKARSGATSDR